MPTNTSAAPSSSQTPYSSVESSTFDIHYQPYYSSHYSQAYMHAYTQAQNYAPPTAYPPVNFASNDSCSNDPRNTASTRNLVWYQPGNSRCTKQGCSFTGSQKTVEIHMMDRHLVFPPGWEKRKKSDWDADPSLKGKPILIQGTNINLDFPGALDAWIAERKKRWPSAPRVEEKMKKMEEAIVRGQLPIGGHVSFKGKKRKRPEDDNGSAAGNAIGRGRGLDRGQMGGRWRDGGWGTRGRGPSRGSLANTGIPPTPVSMAQAPPLATNPELASGASDNEDDNSAPEVVSSKIPQVVPEIYQTDKILFSMKTHGHVRQQQPKKTAPNPFASRPTLLRNLLLPEIRSTISNLSQAIRFLVDNDFLDNVEFKPGDANNKTIKVIDTKDT